MPKPITIRAQMKGDIAEIHVQMNHPMETGQRKDGKTHKLIPAHYIQSFGIFVNDKPVVDGQTGSYLARNPAFAIKVKGAKTGDKIMANWIDNQGAKRSDESVIG